MGCVCRVNGTTEGKGSDLTWRGVGRVRLGQRGGQRGSQIAGKDDASLETKVGHRRVLFCYRYIHTYYIYVYIY